MKLRMYASLLLFCTHYMNAVTITVTNLNDSGVGSLRQAITDASSGDIIAFNTSLAGTITLLTALPTITVNNLTIRGNLSSGAPTIVIDGNNLTGPSYGLDVSSSGSDAHYTIENLAIINCSAGTVETAAGIHATFSSSGSLSITGCYLGTTNGSTISANGNGMYVVGNSSNSVTIEDCIIIGNNTYDGSKGMYINSLGNDITIKGSIISSNGSTAPGEGGLGIFVSGASSGSITNNYIGTNATGTTAAGNTGTGLQIESSTGITIGGSSSLRNIISANGYDGIQLVDCSRCTISYNYLGTDVNGTSGLGNYGWGVEVLTQGASSDLLTIQNNLISANGQPFTNGGISFVIPNAAYNITNATITNNYIGTNYTGELSSNLGNYAHGINLTGNDTALGTGKINNTTITNNIIAHNKGSGIYLYNNVINSTISNNTINSNIIDGSVENSGYGIAIISNAQPCNGNTIGGTNPDDGNIIASNELNGIYQTTVTGSSSMYNSFLRNSIYANGATPGILLSAGENNNQAAPTITDVLLFNPNTVYVRGTAPSSLGSTDLRLEFFVTDPAYSASNPQGQIFAGALDNVAPSSSFSSTFYFVPRASSTAVVTATATAYDNAESLGDTSPFSPTHSALYLGITDLFTIRLITKYY